MSVAGPATGDPQDCTYGEAWIDGEEQQLERTAYKNVDSVISA